MQMQSRFGTYERRPVQRTGMRWWQRALLAVLAAAIVALGTAALAGDRLRAGGMQLEFAPDALIVTAPDRSATTVAYADIRRVTLYTNPDYGACARGGQQAGCWYGTWRNDQWQTYRLCVHPRVHSCVTLETVDGLFAFNASSEGETFRLKAALDELLRGVSTQA